MTIASKLMGTFVTALAVSIFIYAVDFAPEGGYYSLPIPAFFFLFSFLSLVSLPISLLIDIAKRRAKGVFDTLIIYAVVSAGGFGAAAAGWRLALDLRMTHKMVSYGLATLLLFLLLEHLLSTIERKSERKRDHIGLEHSERNE
ncbi:hypothetical protein [Cohnella sp. GCM10027633]|uniref:hypothetical protein n=1 Tax=unclassified Cohnella TaxID=2636738 RepID=UPI003630DAE9